MRRGKRKGIDSLRVAAAIGVEAATGRVAGRSRAGVGSQRIGPRVALEDIHLITAEALAARVEGAVPPRLDGALGVAVAAPVVGTGCVILVGAPVLVHLGQVQRAVLSARQRREVDVEAQLLAVELEHHILAVGAQEVQPRGDAAVAAGAAGHVLVQGEGAARGGDARGGVVDALNEAVLAAGRLVWAQRGVDAAVDGARVVVCVVHPAVVPVEHDGCVLGDAPPRSCALVGCQLGMDLGGAGARLLGCDEPDKGQHGRGQRQCS